MLWLTQAVTNPWCFYISNTRHEIICHVCRSPGSEEQNTLLIWWVELTIVVFAKFVKTTCFRHHFTKTPICGKNGFQTVTVVDDGEVSLVLWDSRDAVTATFISCGSGRYCSCNP